MAAAPPLGAHVDSADPVAAATERGAGLSQFFLGNPQGYKGPEFEYAGGAEALRADAEAAGVDLYVHAPYLINVATTNNRIRIPSRKLLQQFIDAGALIGAKGLIVHGGHVERAADVDLYIHAPYLINVASTNNRIRIPSRKLLQQFIDAGAQIGAKGLIVHGGHVERPGDVDKGFDNWRKAIEATDLKIPLLLENTAGGDNAMARTLERIARVWDAIGSAEGSDNVGFCLDTCHAHAGGIPLATAVDDIRAITGRIDLVHCNDSRDEFDSGADRHTNLGEGLIDPDELAGAVRAAGAPVVIETRGGLEGQQADLDWLRSRL